MDRRQPALRWSAVFAGAAVAVALWVLLQLFGMGAGLAAIEVDDEGSLRSIGIGTTVWTMIAPLIALFVGSVIAGRLANTFDRKVGVIHGFVVWAIASLAGVMAIAWMISAIAGGAMHVAYANFSSDVTIDPSLRAEEIKEASEQAGKILLGSAITLLLALGAAIAGAAIGVRRLAQPRQQEVPVVPPPPKPPSDAPQVSG